MSNPVLVISDTHYHNFKQYAAINAKGINSRLGDILRATVEAAMELKRRGGNVIVHCGDVFHVRGHLPPSVLNPVVDMYKRLIEQGFEVHMISGNHDLETDNTVRVSSSVSALESVGVKVYHEPTVVAIQDERWYFVPWFKDLKHLKEIIDVDLFKFRHQPTNLVIHAPLNGVIVGIPDHGLSPDDFKGLGYRRVYCGHYHNHVEYVLSDGTQVFSVGALTHQNWGDTESRAGYVLHGDDVDQVPTHAPKFRKVSFKDLEFFDDQFYADNYIKVCGGDFTPAEAQAVKDELLLKGAKAVVVEGATKRPAVTRSMGSPSGSAPTLESIMSDYLDRTYPGDTKVKSEALDILRLVE